MSETFAATKEAFRRVMIALRNADDETRLEFGFWVVGLIIMALAIVSQFGLSGALFCFGFVLYVTGRDSN